MEELLGRGIRVGKLRAQQAMHTHGIKARGKRKFVVTTDSKHALPIAPTESLWGRLKVGRLYGKTFATQRDAMDEIIDWLTRYNHRRLHSTLGYVSPRQFEKTWHAAQLDNAA